MRLLVKWFKHYQHNLRVRLLAGFAGTMVLFLLATGLAFLALDLYRNDVSLSLDLNTTALSAREMGSSLQAEALAVANVLITEDVSLEAEYQAQRKALENGYFVSLLKVQLAPTEKEQLNFIIDRHRELVAMYQRLLDSARTKKYNVAQTMWAIDLQPVLDTTLNRVTRLSDLLTQRATLSSAIAQNQVTEYRWWIVIAIALALVLGSLVAWTTMRRIVAQNNRLQTTLLDLQVAHEALEQKQLAGQTVSSEVLSLATGLSSTASQQAGGSHQQVAVVTQVGTSLVELSQAANHIHVLADKVSTAALGVADDSRFIRDTTTLSANRSEQGLDAVERTIAVGLEVAELYQVLLGRVEELKSRHADMRLILKLITMLSNETHLLSLNAAIEAAGAGQFGERFAVVAREVKSLATRSAQASQEVMGIVRQIEAATNDVLEVAQLGRFKATELEEIAGQTGVVIHEMREVAGQSHSQANSISLAANEVKGLIEVIKEATAQQCTATDQVLTALRDLTSIARQSADGSHQISMAAIDLEELSQNLRLFLVV